MHYVWVHEDEGEMCTGRLPSPLTWHRVHGLGIDKGGPEVGSYEVTTRAAIYTDSGSWWLGQRDTYSPHRRRKEERPFHYIDHGQQPLS